MKKLANILTLVLALGFAQTLSAQTFSIGAGSASHIYVFGDHRVAVEPGLSLDFEAGFPITDLFTIGTGASLTGVYGYHFGGNEAKNIGEIFLDIPVRAKFYIPLGSKVSLVPFAGAILSIDGPILFPQKPCPIMLLYGTADKMVPPGAITLFKNHFAGSETLAKKLADIDANFQVFRYKGAGHEISVSMRRNVPEELRFIEENVLKGVYRPLDATLTDAGMEKPGWGSLTTRDLYEDTK